MSLLPRVLEKKSANKESENLARKRIERSSFQHLSFHLLMDRTIKKKGGGERALCFHFGTSQHELYETVIELCAS